MIKWVKTKRDDLKIGDTIFVSHDTEENMGRLFEETTVYKVTHNISGFWFVEGIGSGFLERYGDVYKKVETPK